ncbi:MAG: hypothetical protein Q8R81_09560 [Novosphingobium sp.]|uniref:hypothetical protein n=1 Tax=Novosphingobium sp. TaxID=1874826 RepID=UPI00273584D8|nr:hypothetical protein [Novosphingobium sp.]MDP3550631.1 hypothetical protein [Novosphingobium sp.]
MEKVIEPAPLVERLKTAAQLWVDQHQASLARLGRSVMNDGGFFSRIETNPVTTTATLERFARFLGDAGNWPDGAVPDDVRAFVHVTGVSTEPEGNSTGQINGLSGELDQGAAQEEQAQPRVEHGATVLGSAA